MGRVEIYAIQSYIQNYGLSYSPSLCIQMNVKSLLYVLTVERGKMFKQKMLRLIPEVGGIATTVRVFIWGPASIQV